ncbi:endonuclease [Streptomyces sp. ISL-36]|uniref:endonuclease n=1 Tax=Streptomyces sp. ISL-36 TaxID=2819182 RepID=UPI001BE6784E|nr:endonuclease [Streptomyces sp. ISL-36]MBT2442062.1 endonuclease [Streptomyces sp. ISL-36]
MARSDAAAHVRDLLAEQGRATYAEQAGIRLKDTPQPLYQLLVLAHLLSARIRASTAIDAAAALFAAGMRRPQGMRDASWQQRVDALGEGGYRRYDERTATQLGEEAELVLAKYGGDLRRMRKAADGDVDALRSALREMPGIGPAGADIFLREVQGIWPEVAPYLDRRALEGARRAHLPTDADALADLVPRKELPSLAAALVRASLERKPARSGDRGEKAGAAA